MPTGSPRGARRAAPLALVLALVVSAGGLGCSSVHSSATSVHATAAPTASSSSDPGATGLLTRAQETLAAERSFRFDATETVTAKAATTTRVAGAVVRSQGVAYTLSVGHTTTQVVRLKTATYVRKVPGRWAKLTRPRPVADPVGSLAAILTGLTDARVSESTTTVVGTLSATAAKAAGIPTSSQPPQVTVTIDEAGHVTQVTVHTVTQAGTSAVTVTLVTSYTAFDRVPALRAPR